MASDARKILLVEDEKAIRDAVAAYLEREGYWVVGVGDGQSAVEEFEKHQFDLIVLDLMLPKLSGERVCRAIRDTSDVPIIMLTAKGEVEDRIIGLELGADDYLIKPFSPRELVARVRALFRRAHQADEPQVEVLDFGDLVIDISGHKILVEGKEVDLTASEFKLLTTLARHPGRVYNRMELVEKVLGYDFEGYERTIDSHVKNLRAKLGDDPKKPKWLTPSTAWAIVSRLPRSRTRPTSNTSADGRREWSWRPFFRLTGSLKWGQVQFETHSALIGGRCDSRCAECRNWCLSPFETQPRGG